MSVIQELKANRGGFVRDTDLPEIIMENRLQKMLVRCGGGRFACPAQDVKHFVDIIETDGRDYVRDVSVQ